jgi:hypothetical protein
MREMLNNKLPIPFQKKLLYAEAVNTMCFKKVILLCNKGSVREEFMVAKINLHVIMVVAFKNLIITFSGKLLYGTMQ